MATRQPWSQVTTDYIQNHITTGDGNEIDRNEEFGYCRVTEHFEEDNLHTGISVELFHDPDRKYLIVAIGTITS